MTETCSARTQGEPPWYRGHPCSRKAVKDGFCKTHHPETVAHRRAKAAAESQARWQEKQELWRRKTGRPEDYCLALRAIAEGHNDPRLLAREVLEKWSDSITLPASSSSPSDT